MNAPPARVRRQVEENKRFSGIGRSVPFNLIIIVKFREFFALLRFYRPNSLSFIDLFNIFNEYVNSSNYIIKSLKSHDFRDLLIFKVRQLYFLLHLLEDVIIV